MATATFTGSSSVVERQEVLPLTILKALGSLKITVTMFALAILIVLFGTLAQDEMDLAGVKREYFNCWVAYVPLDVMFPITLVPHEAPYFGGVGFYFPGGATIGLILLVNLIAAKATRFGVQSKGWRLLSGILISLLGTALVVAVIVSGHATDGLQGKPPISYDTLWSLLKGGCVVLTMALVGYSIMGKMPFLARVLSGIAAGIAFLLTAMLVTGGESVRLDNPGLRIVWQLLQASIASVVLLAGLWLIFKQRGGNVLIHAGVGLLMVGQFVFGDRQVEQRIGLAEGSKTNLAVVEDEIEIAIIDTSDPDENVVYAIPEALVRRVAGTERVIDDEALPLKIRVPKFYKNSRLEPLTGEEENLATAGTGLQQKAIEAKQVGGAMMDATNIAAAYVQLIDPESDKPLGTYLLSQELNDRANMFVGMVPSIHEQAKIDGKTYELAIRYRQERKPYDVYLKDVERINYSGTNTARDYSSVIVITDRATGESQEDKTWMNNPTRYRGETFYQSRYNKIPTGNGQFVETTGLQVVENAGWVIPYICCMMVFWGMFAHFGGTFVRYARRFERSKPEEQTQSQASPVKRLAVVGVSLAVVLLSGLYYAVPKNYSAGEVDWNAVARLPVQHEGRIKPLDSVARNILQQIAEPIFGATPTIKDKDGNKHTPSDWLLSVMAGQEWVQDAEIFRVYSKAVQNFMELDPARDNSRYSLRELENRLPQLREEMAGLRGKETDEFTFREQKLVKLFNKLNLYDLIVLSYREPPLPSPQGVDSEEERERFFNAIMQTFEFMKQLEQGNPPALIPPVGKATQENLADATWQAYGPARFKSVIGVLMSMESETKNPAVESFADIIVALREGDNRGINKAVETYSEQLGEMPLAASSLDRVATEKWLNAFNPIGQGVVLYLFAILLGFASFLLRFDALRRGAFWLLVGVLVIHTIAIISRIYISGRAPVINLYSASVFIGWACVLLSLVMEVLYPIGVANLVGGLIGVMTLSVARFLDTSDTMPVLQAVLDTQFWLSTHVVTVTAGYSVTFLAGFIGICLLVHRMITKYDSYPSGQRPEGTKKLQRDMYAMCYGAVCFGIFFSFIGTVLGGLWADDSWGRFWGWDPKENGAMMIVLWNALLLHARWDKQVTERGFAALAVIGNVVTTWSFFGTNQLGIGLHAYGGADVGADEAAPTLLTDPFGALRENGSFYGVFGFILLNLLFVVIALLITKAMSASSSTSKQA